MRQKKIKNKQKLYIYNLKMNKCFQYKIKN